MLADIGGAMGLILGLNILDVIMFCIKSGVLLKTGKSSILVKHFNFWKKKIVKISKNFRDLNTYFIKGDVKNKVKINVSNPFKKSPTVDTLDGSSSTDHFECYHKSCIDAVF